MSQEIHERRNLLSQFRKWKKRKRKTFNIVVTERSRREMAEQVIVGTHFWLVDAKISLTLIGSYKTILISDWLMQEEEKNKKRTPPQA